ncbi:MAG TPA: transcriptional activator RfaH [Verrucomicrobiae bacterium]|jgi:transcriptional antiterminator RfaH|nr:transcriptional activator RfaH [Verrucomicrobiae bacterium]
MNFWPQKNITSRPVLDSEAPDQTPAWFCLRTQPKHEHVAAAQLRQDAGVEVFLPRIRYQRATRKGPAWVTEALFPNYLFARFDLRASLRHVQATRGVSGVVHFGQYWPSIPQTAIHDLREAMEGADLRVIEDILKPGDAVQIIDGALLGLEAVVARVMPAQSRVAVLLNFLGRQTTVELDRNQLIFPATNAPRLSCFAAVA